MTPHSSRLVTAVTCNAVKCMDVWVLDAKVPRMKSVFCDFGCSSHLLLLEERVNRLLTFVELGATDPTLCAFQAL